MLSKVDTFVHVPNGPGVYDIKDFNEQKRWLLACMLCVWLSHY